MAKGNRDLDRSLDDTIKSNSSKGRGGKRSSTNNASRNAAVNKGNNVRRQAHSTRVSNPPNTSNRNTSKNHVNNRIGSKSINQRVGGNDNLINSRLGRGISKPHRGSGVGKTVSTGVVNILIFLNWIAIRLNFFLILAKWLDYNQQI